MSTTMLQGTQTRYHLFLSGLDPDTLSSAIKFIFSWVVLLPIGVITTGKLLNQRLKLRTGPGQRLRIPTGILNIEASGAEVILGFSWYMICLLLLGTAIGVNVRAWVLSHFGVDAGQFNALGFMSSLFSVTVAFVVFLLSKLPGDPAEAKALRTRNQIVNRITAEKTGQNPEDLPGVEE
jgi:hypothetical protein